MKQTEKDAEKDDRLAEFADRVLAGKSGQTESKADDELRGLEETVLRLNRALPRPELDSAALKRLESRLAARLQQEQKSAQVPFWHKWFGWNWKYGQFRPQVAVAVGLILTGLAVLIALMSPIGGKWATAAAHGTGQTALTLIALAGLILVIIWINRRK